MKNTERYSIPDWAISYMFNGDRGDLMDFEVKKLDDFMEMVGRPIGEVGEKYYLHRNDIDAMGADCFDVDFYKEEKNG